MLHIAVHQRDSQRQHQGNCLHHYWGPYYRCVSFDTSAGNLCLELVP